MPVTLPEPIRAYFIADREKSPMIGQCFTQNAVVIDEKNTYRGRDSIVQWKMNSSQKYNYTSEPFAVEQEGERIIVTSHVSGDFPGSPVDLRYAFILEGEAIAFMEITL